MRLKQIKLAGFKSFVDITKIPFDKPLTAIVGPNGCGKSNVIDAVRWVLGESSAKNLRGDSMTDVIFNGSSVRRPISVASVELIFENCDGKLPGQYASYQEIAVKRQVSRDGDSQYFLNGQKCRRKDITDLFMGTGLGPRSYAIIEQGTISRLIESKPQDLRVFIEEAAGISRYKERRRETENRIRHTRENLERLNDIRVELGSQLEKLAEQAKSALTYRAFKQSERNLHGQLLVVRHQELSVNAQALALKVQSFELELAQVNAKSITGENQLIQFQHALAELNEQEQHEVERFYQTKTDIAKCEQALQHKQAQDSQWQQQYDALDIQLAQVKDQYNISVEARDALLAQQGDSAAFGQDFYDQIALLDEQIAELEDSAAERGLGLTQLAESASAAKMALALSEAKREHVSQNISRDEGKIISLKQALTAQNVQEYQQTLAKLEQDVTQCQQSLTLEAEINHRLEDSLQGQKEKFAELSAEHQSVLNQFTSASARLQLIDEWLKDEQKEQADGQPLWQHLTVAPGWENAVELALQGILHMPVLDGDAQTTLGIPAIGFAQNTQYSIDQPALIAKVNLAPWLGQLTWLDSLSQALAQQQTLTEKQAFITQDGYLVGQGFVLRGMAKQQSALLLTNEKLQLTTNIDTLSQRLTVLSQALDAEEAGLMQLQQQLNASQQTCHALQLEYNKLASSMANLTQQQTEKAQRLAQSEQELKHLNLHVDDLLLQQQGLEDLIDSQAVSSQNAGMAQDRLNQEWQSLHAQLKSIKAGRSDKDKLRGHHEKAQQRLETALALKEQEIGQQLSQERALNLSVKALLERKQVQGEQSVEDVQLHLQQALAQYLAEQTEQQGRLTSIRAQQTQVQEQIDQLVLAQKQQLGVIEGLTQKIGELKLRREGLKGQGDAQEQLLQEHEVDVSAVIKLLTPEITVAQLSMDLEKIRVNIARLGAINLAAIDEYEVQRQRKAYLDDQDDDLNKGLLILEDAIRKIDRETRSRFKATFDAVNHDLGLLFPKVFGGGRAYLALTGDDLLETGVTIMAQPPGKKNSSIHLLSGGEKALTALSLVFAIFRLNPAPFCMLDEVDAPLDDANVERFCRLLKEMSQSVQFIYISHNKITMELADQLIGVTMHEPGVSRIVAVDIEQAVAMADAL
jgi:chromosome segregation protein